MSEIDDARSYILGELLAEFRQSGRKTIELNTGYVGIAFDYLQRSWEGDPVSFDVAIEEFIKKRHIGTGPYTPYKNDPGSGVVLIGGYYAREYAHLTEEGYKAAVHIGAKSKAKREAVRSEKGQLELHFYGIHPTVVEKCGTLYEAGAFAEAVEKGFKIVRARLRELTAFETGSDAFGRGKLHIAGAAAANVDEDFNQGVKFLTMAIDRFRNEKAHAVDGNITDPIRAHQYLSLSSLALYLLERAEIIDDGI